MFEIAHAAVHKPGRPAGRSAGEVVAFDERDGESAEGGIARDTRSRDSAADDQEVERGRGEMFPGLLAPLNSRGKARRDG